MLEKVHNGPGIPGAERARLYLAPLRGRDATGIPGTGMGLLPARRMVEDQGGALELICPEEGGTVARVRLPTPAAKTPMLEDPFPTRAPHKGFGHGLKREQLEKLDQVVVGATFQACEPVAQGTERLAPSAR